MRSNFIVNRSDGDELTNSYVGQSPCQRENEVYASKGEDSSLKRKDNFFRDSGITQILLEDFLVTRSEVLEMIVSNSYKLSNKNKKLPHIVGVLPNCF